MTDDDQTPDEMLSSRVPDAERIRRMKKWCDFCGRHMRREICPCRLDTVVADKE